MAVKTKEQLRDYTNTYINTNGVQAITGASLNTLEIDMIDTFATAAGLVTAKAALRLVAASGQTFTTTQWDKLHFDAVTLQRNGITATATGADHSITVSVGGWYEVFFGISCIFPTQDVLELVAYINGVEYSSQYTEAVGQGTGDPIVMAWKSTVQLTAGDVLDLRGRNSPEHGSGSLALTYSRLYLDVKQDI